MGCSRDMATWLTKTKEYLSSAQTVYKKLKRRSLVASDEALIYDALLGAKRAEVTLTLLVERVERRGGVT